MTGTLFIISAPSGAGKTTVTQAVLERIQSKYSVKRVITYTSRNMREGEVNGRDYYFISPADFEIRIENGFFLEWSSVYGTYYGSPRDILRDMHEGISYILIIDRAGAQQILHQKLTIPIVPIWIDVPSLDHLRERLVKRKAESEKQIDKRLEIARNEIALEQQQSMYHYHVMNEYFDDAVVCLCDIVCRQLQMSVASSPLKVQKTTTFEI